MAPKKNIKQTSAPVKSVPEKSPRKRAAEEKVETPKVKTATVIKLKIPYARKSRKY